MRWFTADTHFGHANILRFEPNRPWVETNQMNLGLVERLASQLRPGDEVWHLGDAALGQLDGSLPFLAMLGVPVTLVAGNHDRVHPYHGDRAERFIEIYREKCRLAGLVLTNTRLTLADGSEVQLSHFPVPGPVTGRTGGSSWASGRRQVRRVASSRRRWLVAVRPRPRRLAPACPPDQRRGGRMGWSFGLGGRPDPPD